MRTFQKYCSKNYWFEKHGNSFFKKIVSNLLLIECNMHKETFDKWRICR